MFERLGFGEVVLILVVALLIFGPSKLPQLGRSVGEGMKEFKKAIRSLSDDAGDATPAKKE